MSKRYQRSLTGINIVPLVDVLIVLIFFFLMTMHFRTLSVLDIKPPKIRTAGQQQKDNYITISISEVGEFFWDAELVSEEALIAKLKSVASKDKASEILIVADENSALKHVTLVMDECRLNKLDRIKLQSR